MSPLEHYVDPEENEAVLTTSGNLRHGLYSPQAMARAAARVREQLLLEYPGVEGLSLPTVELYCRAKGRAVALSEWCIGVMEGRIKTQPVGKYGKARTGVEAIPERIWKALEAAERQAARLAQDLGLDLTGRAKLGKDSAIANHFARDRMADLTAEGKRLRELRSSDPGSLWRIIRSAKRALRRARRATAHWRIAMPRWRARSWPSALLTARCSACRSASAFFSAFSISATTDRT